MTVILIAAAVAALGAIGTVVVTMRRVHEPTTGTAIDRRGREKRALLIVDMQTDFIEGNGYPQAEVERKTRAINARAEEARSANVPIATLRQIYQGPVATTVIRLVGKGLGNPDSSGLELHSELDAQAAADFVKSRLDGFSNPALEQWLASRRVGAVEIMGLDGCYCVKATAIGALNRGFDVHLHDDTILAANQTKWRTYAEQLRAKGAQHVGHNDQRFHL
jgi:nicotinamidase-related amidase